MSLTELCILMAMGYLCVHSIISRICKCVENCYTAKYYKGGIPGFEKDRREYMGSKNHQPVPGRDEVK